MTIIIIESEWRESGILCPSCGAMTYTDGKHPTQCPVCLAVVDEVRKRAATDSPNTAREGKALQP